MRRFLVLGAVVSVLVAGEVRAQAPSGPLPSDQVIAIRQAMMDLQGGVTAAMKATVEAKTDVKPLTAGAEGLVSSSKVIAMMFPVGTEKGHDTKAKAEIWSDWAGFQKDANGLTEAAEKLVTLAKANDTAGFATQFVAVGRTCGACHRSFKEKD